MGPHLHVITPTPLTLETDRGGHAFLIQAPVPHQVRTVVIREDMFCWVQSGSKTLLSLHAPRPCPAGEALLLQRGSQWDVSNDPPPRGRYIAQVLTFARDLVREAAVLSRLTTAHVVRGASVLAVDAELATAVERAASSLGDTHVSRILQRHRLMEVMLLLAERGLRFDTGSELSWNERLRLLIGQRPHEAWTIEALARAFHTSPSTLRRRIAESGCTLGQLVREVRLETALALLQSSELNVGDIAARCGYGSHSRFSAAFRHRFGLAPSDLRPEQKHNVNGIEQSLAQRG